MLATSQGNGSEAIGGCFIGIHGEVEAPLKRRGEPREGSRAEVPPRGAGASGTTMEGSVMWVGQLERQSSFVGDVESHGDLTKPSVITCKQRNGGTSLLQ